MAVMKEIGLDHNFGISRTKSDRRSMKMIGEKLVENKYFNIF